MIAGLVMAAVQFNLSYEYGDSHFFMFIGGLFIFGYGLFLLLLQYPNTPIGTFCNRKKKIIFLLFAALLFLMIIYHTSQSLRELL